ncbi:spore germination protein [Natranaerofaba carboxydovora]|uniref:spore germination protein n=1 Tax=Natranaerofaba carboxydovora TaxID=2742683 RepID=UPI001F143739|nr:spore germination protein [Natranaerofaba carboxydovora]UMZ74121.1 Spore germination protein B1 [Natranaerofaba carboxydovora]
MKKLINKIKNKIQDPNKSIFYEESSNNEQYISKKVDENEKTLKNEIFSNNEGDLEYRTLYINDSNNKKIKILLVFVDSLTDDQIINEDILKPLMLEQRAANISIEPSKELSKSLGERVLNVSDVSYENIMNTVVEKILDGYTAVFVEGSPECIIADTKGWDERAVSEAEAERTIRGPQTGFNENIKASMGLIRRRIKSPELKVKQFVIGRRSKTKVNVLWMEGICNEKIIQEVTRRLDSLDVDQLICATNLSEMIDDNPLSPFNSQFLTERPDVASAGLLEGRAAVLIDGTVTSLIVPMLFIENLISPADFYGRYHYIFIVRWIRYVAAIISEALPAFYVSVISFHPEIIPTILAARVYGSREGVPFPAFIEMIIVGVFFESLREAGATIPLAFGSAVSIIGALILGQQVVEAGIISSIGVIIGAVTGISSFLIPNVEFTRSLILPRFIFTILAALLGMYGVMAGVLLMLYHLASMRSFGVPYLSPMAPFELADIKAFIMRTPYFLQGGRPKSFEAKDKKRQSPKLSKFFFKYKITEE